jgi:signal transduction histidine kinase
MDINPAAQDLSRRLGLADQSRTLEARLNARSAESLISSVMAVAERRRVAQHTASDVDVDGLPVELVVRWHAAGSDSDPDYTNVYVALQDVTELTIARQRIEATLESQNRFIASISHELRTPLTAVLGFSHELQNESLVYGEGDLEEFRELIEHHAIEMSHIIEDLLVWSRSDIGEVTINFEPFDIGRIVERTLRSLPGSPAALVDGYPKVDVMADPVRVRQILRNLVTNAFRYGGDEIFVEVVDAEDSVRVEVHDTGPEIPPDKARSIFLPYQRLDAQQRTMPSSIGLGLAISRVLAELQDGSLTLERTERSNAFVLTLRKARRRGHLMPDVERARPVARVG